MTSRRITMLIFIAMTCFGNATNATLITDLKEIDWKVSGDKSLTYDSTTGLEWLDLSYTRGNSILDTEAKSFFGEFRWATALEIDTIFNTVLAGNGYRSSTDTKAFERATTFASLFSNDPYSISHGVTRTTTSNTLASNKRSYIYISDDYNNVYVNDGSTTGGWTATSNYSEVGHWLVRSTGVPEPSIFAIFAFGMIGLASYRFKR